MAAAGISRRGRAELALATRGGRRTLTPAEVASLLQIDRVQAAKRLARWADEGWVRRVRRGLYIPVPVDAEHPSAWSEESLILADTVWAPCYFSGWTAASHWALTEQVFRTTVVKTAARVRRSRQGLLEHAYLLTHVHEGEMAWGMARLWRYERRLLVADPARTVVDVLDDPRLGGGIRHCAEIVAAYLDDHDARDLIEYGERLGNRAVFKRLGYLTERAGLGHAELVEACRARLSAGVSLLDPSGPTGGERVSDWGLRANVRIGQRDAS